MGLRFMEHFLILTDEPERTRDWWVDTLGFRSGASVRLGWRLGRGPLDARRTEAREEEDAGAGGSGSRHGHRLEGAAGGAGGRPGVKVRKGDYLVSPTPVAADVAAVLPRRRAPRDVNMSKCGS